MSEIEKLIKFDKTQIALSDKADLPHCVAALGLGQLYGYRIVEVFDLTLNQGSVSHVFNIIMLYFLILHLIKLSL